MAKLKYRGAPYRACGAAARVAARRRAQDGDAGVRVVGGQPGSQDRNPSQRRVRQTGPVRRQVLQRDVHTIARRHRTPAGTMARSGVSRRTSARTTASASSSAVKVFVTGPIWNSVVASTGRPSGRSEVPRPTTVVSPLRASTTPSASPTCRRAAESAARVRTSATLASMSAPLGEGVGGVDALPAQRRERDRVSEPTSGRAGTVSATVPRARSRSAQ